MLKVLVSFDTARENYFLRSRLVDESGTHWTQDILHRDLGQVRSYYMGWITAARMCLPGEKIVLPGYKRPYNNVEFVLPAQLPIEFDDTVPEEWRHWFV